VIALPSGTLLPASEAKTLACAVATTMAALVTIGGTSEAAQRREGLANFLWPQYLLAAAVAIIGTYSAHLLPVLLVLAFTLICLTQVVLAQRETFIPRRSMSSAAAPAA